jgi:MarR family transcriptional regulator, transcriptional regulator for hemolysin
MEEFKPLGYLLGRSLRVFKAQVAEEVKSMDFELSLEQYVILYRINSSCDLIQQDLANHFQKDKSLIVRQINGLIEKQYLVRLTNQEDKRKKNLILTQKGLDMMNQMTGLVMMVSRKLLSGVSDSDYAIFNGVLNKIQENGGSV